MRSPWCAFFSTGSAAILAAIAPLWSVPGGAQTVLPGIQPDATLPVPSQVEPAPAGARIAGGTAAGNNLFHSFETFSIPSGAEVRFAVENAAIESIVTRVTGDLASQIDGTLAVDGSASFFFINPNGVFFGPNASLDLRGAFVASTADAVDFGDLGQFAADPTTSSNPSLLSVAPSALFFNQLNAPPAPISNASARGLAVDPGQSLLLAGGETTFGGGRAIAPDGQIGIVALAQPTAVGLRADAGTPLHLAVPATIAGAPLTFTAGARLDASGPGGGRIELRAGEIALTGGAEVLATTSGSGNGRGIAIDSTRLSLAEGAVIATNTFGSGTAGDITIAASEIDITGSEVIAPLLETILPGFNILNPDGVDIDPDQLPSNLIDGFFALSLGSGNAGNIELQVETLSVGDGAAIATTSFIEDMGGAGGDLEIFATERAVIAGGSLLASGTTGPSPSGNLKISTPQLEVSGSLLTTSTTSSGPGGTLEVSGADRVELSGSLPPLPDQGILLSGGLFTATVSPDPAAGPAGSLTIDTGELIVRDGASAATNSLGAGAGGNLTITATEIIDLSTPTPGGESLGATAVSSGDGGDIFVTTPQLILRDGGLIAANTILGSGNGGNINIAVDRIDITNGGAIAANTIFGPGNGGIINIAADRINIADGSISANTFGSGNGGAIEVAAERIAIAGQAPTSALLDLLTGFNLGVTDTSLEISPDALLNALNNGLFAVSLGLPNNAGSAGSITIRTGQLSAQNGAAILTSAFSSSNVNAPPPPSNAGALSITATEKIAIESGSIFSSATTSSQPAGNLTFETPQLTVDEGFITTSTLDSGAGGALTIRGASRVELAGTLPVGLDVVGFELPAGLAVATLGSGDAGPLTIETGTLIVRDGASAAANTLGSGNGGNLTITATNSIELIGAAVGIPGAASLQANSSSTLPNSGNGGTIAIATPNLRLREGGAISSFTFGAGDGGDISIRANNIEIVGTQPFPPLVDIIQNIEPEQILPILNNINATLDEELNSGLFTLSTGSGAAGSIEIGGLDSAGSASALLATNGAAITTAAFGGSAAGTLTIAADDIVIQSSFASTGTFFFGSATGDIEIDAERLSVLDGGLISSTALTPGQPGIGGTLTISARESIELAGPESTASLAPGSNSALAGLLTTTAGSGNAGDILIDTQRLTVRDGAQIDSSTSGAGDGGQIAVNATDILLTGTSPIDGDPSGIAASADISQFNIDGGFDTFSGNAGDIAIETGTLIVRDGASVSTSTSGSGAGGNLIVTATDAIELIGPAAGPQLAASLQANTGVLPSPGSTTGSGTGPGGDISIKTPRLELREGGAISAFSFGSGNGGNITIDANNIDIIGTQSFPPLVETILNAEPEDIIPFLNDIVTTLDEELNSGLFTLSTGSGVAGSIDIKGLDSLGRAETLRVTDGAAISSATLTIGSIDAAEFSDSTAGTLTIAANDIVIQSSIASTNTIILLPPGPPPDNVTTSSGDVEIDAERLSVLDGGLVTSTALTPGLPGVGGVLTISARESIELAGPESAASLAPGADSALAGLLTTTAGSGPAGDITIDTEHLTLRDGAEINSSTTNAGDGGQIAVNATDILLTGTSPIDGDSSGIAASATTDPFSRNGIGAPTGNAGDIAINLLDDGQLTISTGATIATSTAPGTEGSGGEIAVDAGSTDRGTILIEGVSSNGLASSLILATTLGNGPAAQPVAVDLRAATVRLENGGAVVAGTFGTVPTSTGGGIAVEADTIILDGVPDGIPLASGLYTATSGPANAGNLTLSARQLSILNGAIATTSTIADGNSGLFQVAVTDSLTVAGVSESGEIVSTLLSGTLGTGSAGNLDIQAGGTLRVADNGFIGAGTSNPFLGEGPLVFSLPGIGLVPVPNVGTGTAGTATIAAEAIELDNGRIGIATAGADDGNLGLEGNLDLIAGENLLLINGSEITAEATQNSNGGNITITTNFGSVVLKDSSSIIANADAGNGGNIQIGAAGLFPCSTCSITASSNVGTDGIVQVSSPDVNPADSLIALPARLSDPSEQIAARCAPREGNRFALVGRGGLPPGPGDRLQTADLWTDLRDFTTPAENPLQASERHTPPDEPNLPPLQEATGWYRHANGEVELVAASSAPRNSLDPHDCGTASLPTTTPARHPAEVSVELGAARP